MATFLGWKLAILALKAGWVRRGNPAAWIEYLQLILMLRNDKSVQLEIQVEGFMDIETKVDIFLIQCKTNKSRL